MHNERKPRSFNDTKGRTWRLSISIGVAMKVRNNLGIDLLASDTQNVILKLAADPITLCGVLWILVEDQATTAGVDQAAFWEALSDDSVEAATFAFLDALIDFFPLARQGVLRRIVAKMREADAKRLAHVVKRVDAGHVDQLIEAEIDKQLADLDQKIGITATTPGD